MIVRNRYFKVEKTPASRVLLIVGLLMSAAIIVSLYSSVALADEHGETGELEYKVDLENKSGVNLIIAKLYNDNRLLFALAVTATMAVVGIIIGQITGVILRFLGLK